MEGYRAIRKRALPSAGTAEEISKKGPFRSPEALIRHATRTIDRAEECGGPHLAVCHECRLSWAVRTAMPREKAQAAPTARPKVPMRRLVGADCFVVAMKRGNARGAKGAGHRHWDRVNRQREKPDINGRRQPSCGDKSNTA